MLKYEIFITNIVLILHHLIATCLQWVFYNTWCYGIIYIISLTELSNIPGYYSYYFKKIKKQLIKNILQMHDFITNNNHGFIRVILLRIL